MTWALIIGLVVALAALLLVLSCCWVSGNAAQREEDERGVRRS